LRFSIWGACSAATHMAHLASMLMTCQISRCILEPPSNAVDNVRPTLTSSTRCLQSLADRVGSSRHRPNWDVILLVAASTSVVSCITAGNRCRSCRQVVQIPTQAGAMVGLKTATSRQASIIAGASLLSPKQVEPAAVIGSQILAVCKAQLLPALTLGRVRKVS